VIHHIKGREKELDPVADDDGHWGDAQSAYGTLFASGDESVEVGLWQFEGEQHTAPQDGYEEVIVVLEGSATIECDGGSYDLTAGDVLIYDTPIGGKRIHAPDGFRAAYVVRYRDRGNGAG